MDAASFRKLGHELIEWVAGYREQVERLPVMSPVRPGEIRLEVLARELAPGEPVRIVVRGLETDTRVEGTLGTEMLAILEFFSSESVTPDEALQRLLSPEAGTGYLAPREAVVEAMRDLRAHELATLAGLEAAIRGMFARFDPARLEQDFSDRSLLATILPAHRKAKCWDLFAQQFRQIGEEAREDFNALFGREFARAYEEQVRRLHSARPR